MTLLIWMWVHYIETDGLRWEAETKANWPFWLLRSNLNSSNECKQGHGAFGTVYRAIHKNAKRAFALKKISKKEVKNQNMITQLNNEIKISRQLDHPNIIKLYDTFDTGEDIYLVLELAQNGQLYSKVVREGKLDERTTIQMIKEVLEAVSYLHSRDPPIIHRDIKPENILLDKNNRVKLAGNLSSK